MCYMAADELNSSLSHPPLRSKPHPSRIFQRYTVINSSGVLTETAFAFMQKRVE